MPNIRQAQVDPLDIIRAVKRNWTPDQYTRGTFARKADGTPVDWQKWKKEDGGTPVSFCAVGAIYREADRLGLMDCRAVTFKSNNPAVEQAFDILGRESEARTRKADGGYLLLPGINDNLGYDAVMEVIDGVLKNQLPAAPQVVEERELVTA